MSDTKVLGWCRSEIRQRQFFILMCNRDLIVFDLYQEMFDAAAVHAKYASLTNYVTEALNARVITERANRDHANENSHSGHRHRVIDGERNSPRVGKRKETATGRYQKGGTSKKEGRRGGLPKGAQKHTRCQGETGPLERDALDCPRHKGRISFDRCPVSREASAFYSHFPQGRAQPSSG